MNHRSPQHPPRRNRRAFTFVELMASLIIFSLVATAGTYLLATSAKTQSYVQGGANTESEIEFAIQRITENIRAATAVTPGTSSVTITSPPSPRVSGNPTFTITYNLVNSNLIEIYTNNANNSSYSNGTIAHNVTAFTPVSLSSNTFRVTLTAGAANTSITRVFVAYSRNVP